MATLSNKGAISCWVFLIQNSSIAEHHVETSLHTDWRGARQYLEEIYGVGAVQFAGTANENSNSGRSLGRG
jgi:hypothetical protein